MHDSYRRIYILIQLKSVWYENEINSCAIVMIEKLLNGVCFCWWRDNLLGSSSTNCLKIG